MQRLLFTTFPRQSYDPVKPWKWNEFYMELDCTPMLEPHSPEIDARYLFMRHYQEDGMVKIIFIKSIENKSNIMTKNTPTSIFCKHINTFMVTDSTADITK